MTEDEIGAEYNQELLDRIPSILHEHSGDDAVRTVVANVQSTILEEPAFDPGAPSLSVRDVADAYGINRGALTRRLRLERMNVDVCDEQMFQPHNMALVTVRVGYLRHCEVEAIMDVAHSMRNKAQRRNGKVVVRQMVAA